MSVVSTFIGNCWSSNPHFSLINIHGSAVGKVGAFKIDKYSSLDKFVIYPFTDISGHTIVLENKLAPTVFCSGFCLSLYFNDLSENLFPDFMGMIFLGWGKIELNLFWSGGILLEFLLLLHTTQWVLHLDMVWKSYNRRGPRAGWEAAGYH